MPSITASGTGTDIRPASSKNRDRAVTGLFALALFGSASLLFSLQPMVAKTVLPTLGGTPMVWNTCMVFFQAVLLAGYGAAHAAARHSRRGALWLYPAVLAGAVLFLPLSFTGVPDPGDRPAWWLISELIRVAGLPVLGLSMSAPALQAWYSRTRLAGADDPYFLYAASNTGSALALLAYPAIMEPLVGLQSQSSWWATGFTGFALVAGACMLLTRGDSQTSRRGADGLAAHPGSRRSRAEVIALWRQRLRWTALAFVPSSLMLGVTTYISTDIAAVPLIWITPLALYLATFVVAFSVRSTQAAVAAGRRLPLLAVAIVFMVSANIALPMEFNIPLHLAAFAAAALMCHGRLAAERPPADRLTEFYLFLSVGGAAGGLFNTFVAPHVFTSVTEYPVVLLCACAVPALGWRGSVREMARDAGYALGAGALAAISGLILARTVSARGSLEIVVAGVLALITFSQARRPLRFPLMLAAVLAASSLTRSDYGVLLHAERTFFGSYHVSLDETRRFHALYHGTTLHGLQAWPPAGRPEPLTYYHRDGPFGQAFERLPRLREASDVAAVGLGVGSLSAYASAAQHWTFFEIDPAIERIARDPRYFGFLQACGPRCRVVLGDARVSLGQSEAAFDAIVLDAFSSDAIPMHLVTREAIELYLSRLKTGGLLLFHISNRYLALNTVLATLAEDRGLVAMEQLQERLDPAAVARGQRASHWVVLAADGDVLSPLAGDGRWISMTSPLKARPWTDDFSNILTTLKLLRR